MAELKTIKRPGTALIKLIEAVGLLLGVDRTYESHYKVPCPSCYDPTLEILSNDFNGVIDRLVTLQSDGIPNQLANDLLEKILEPGFNFDEAINDGGSRTRELFDVIMYILNELQNNQNRYPTQTSNVYVIMNGTRVSYLALDVATHIFNHGVCIAGVMNYQPIKFNSNFNQELFNEYLCSDITRRFRNQYKLQDHKCAIEYHTVDDSNALSTIQSSVEQNNISIIVAGINESNIKDEFQRGLINWMVKDNNITSVFVKGQSSARPFDKVITPKKYLIYADINNKNILAYLTKCCLCMRPTDEYVVLVISDSPRPVGNSKNPVWVNGTEHPSSKKTPGWNYVAVMEFCEKIHEFVIRSKMIGRIRREEKSVQLSLSKQICDYATEESAEMIVLERGDESYIVMECIQEASGSVVVVK